MTRGFTFGSFCLLPRQRLLLQEERPVHVGSRALDILVMLVERPGEIVAREELMARVWPRTVVCEDNLTVHISALRRVLKEGGLIRCIVNVPGRGYLFTELVETSTDCTISASHGAGAAQLAA